MVPFVTGPRCDDLTTVASHHCCPTPRYSLHCRAVTALLTAGEIALLTATKNSFELRWQWIEE